ncbi:hypothetical protein [Brevibacillus choshinensis]|uniref:Uncharacterized protein n=1 Tax=Brevibacillus choshinensis TaxID=54911 RepID=A0ABX7FT15_BRECH|nr:hypothetical protein [Brevibacillus choshinensis]QRG68481.1 hypothetical protein JNE38_04720 [Brevibacillus choshinensis]
MFHPLVFDNIRVVLEGAVYDRDFDGAITITGRSDVMDMATFHRQFQIEFKLATANENKPFVLAQMQLRTTLADIAAEQLEQPLTDQIGCTICIHFHLPMNVRKEIPEEARAITALLDDIWGQRPYITHTLKARLEEKRYEWPPQRVDNQITLDFYRKIDEGNIDDLRDLIDHTIQSLLQLQAYVER